MQTFRTPTHTVETRRTADGYEFTTYGADGNVISTVQHALNAAVTLIRALALRA